MQRARRLLLSQPLRLDLIFKLEGGRSVSEGESGRRSFGLLVINPEDRLRVIFVSDLIDRLAPSFAHV